MKQSQKYTVKRWKWQTKKEKLRQSEKREKVTKKERDIETEWAKRVKVTGKEGDIETESERESESYR